MKIPDQRVPSFGYLKKSAELERVMREYSRTYTQYYTNGTAARQIAQPEYERPERRRSEQELPDYAKVRKNSTQKGLKLAMNPGFAVFLAFAVAATLGACYLMLSMQAKVSTQSNTISTLQSEIETLADDNNAYEARLNSSVNLDQIRDRAMNELGMVYPTEGQVVYYDLTESDYVHQFTDIPQ